MLSHVVTCYHMLSHVITCYHMYHQSTGGFRLWHRRPGGLGIHATTGTRTGIARWRPGAVQTIWQKLDSFGWFWDTFSQNRKHCCRTSWQRLELDAGLVLGSQYDHNRACPHEYEDIVVLCNVVLSRFPNAVLFPSCFENRDLHPSDETLLEGFPYFYFVQLRNWTVEIQNIWHMQYLSQHLLLDILASTIFFRCFFFTSMDHSDHTFSL